MRIFPLRAAVLAVALTAALAPWLAHAAPLSLDAAIDLALQRSEAAHSARAGAASATESARAAGQLPDPTLRVGIDNLPVTGPDRASTTRDSMTMKRIGVGQEWLSRDKRAARQAAADAAVQREAVQVRVVLAETRLQTALAYLDAFYASEVLTLSELMVHHAHEELEASRARLASSSGSSQDVLALSGARGVAEDESADARQRQSAAGFALQRWTGVQADALAPMPAVSLPNEEVFVAGHPLVAKSQSEIEVARQAAVVAGLERHANWSWEVSYGQRTGYSDMVSVGVNIPLQVAPADRQDRETAARLALVDKAEAELAEARRAASAEYRALASDAQRLQERIARYRSGVGAAAEQRTAAATAGYRSNQTSLTTLFEARHAEVEAQRKLLMLQRDLAKTRVQLVFKTVDAGAVR